MPALSRRAFLRGAGVAVSLPMLDAMRPAFAADKPAVPRRMIAIQTNMGILPQNFFPAEAGTDYTPTAYLELLKEHKDKLTVLSGVSHPDVDGAHEAERSFLSAAPHPGGAGFRNSISLDQYAAEQLGPVTRFPSFTLDVNAEGTQGMVFSRSGVKVPSEKSPAALYKKMFVQGNPAEVEARVADLGRGRSALDFVSDDAKRLGKKLGPADRDRLDQYFSAVRDLERQLELGQEWERKPKPKPTAPAPTDVTENKKLIDKIRLMLDIARLGFESDSTRVVTLFVNTFSIVADLPGVKDETHSITHHGGRKEALDQLFTIEAAQFKALAQFLGGLAGAAEGGESLLDRTMVLYGAPMGNAASHDNRNLPVLIAGGGFKHAGHLKFDAKKNYPLPNLYVSMLQRMGVPAERFASSTGTLTGLRDG
ncbi:Uncharacterized protein OS=Chthoniobacter flavus Ellin428 GN=CfE428DRAFT_3278 PE=4 SV=1: HXXSHH [Gemmataceae bacterium]|nr:Uncharacterized protein OS=Chthoniobacter flavus Ellin428 GN=CfE428DRAFT_3278 PE=4 SV=1: HXXSHH [Gemmataceae bacterium]VTT97614.1 Uncharacterized protein OS=Chthoniobacter flavus Ellin428 GN=CfE428DRAFT_3278 PE=4 SV=1: HXXSHH [Gemmataceae bacterium]